MNTPFSPNSLSFRHIIKNADTVRTPGAPFIICKAGFKVSAVGCEAPDT